MAQWLDFVIDKFLPDRVIGLDIGSSYVKLVQLEKKRTNYELIRFKVLPVSRATEAGNEDVLIENRENVLVKLREVFESCNLKEDKIPVVASVGGKSVVIKRIYVDLRGVKPDEEREVLESEAEQYIPYDINDCILRFNPIDEPPDDQGREPVLLISAKRDLVQDYTSLLIETGCRLECIDADIIALCNMFEMNYPEIGGVNAIINLGAKSTNINVISNGVSFFNREILKGGVHISENISTKLNMSFEEAENIKVGETLPEDLEVVIEDLCEEIISGIKQSFDFFLSTHPDMEIERIFLTGGTSRLKGLRQMIQQSLGIVTEIIDPFKRVSMGKLVDVDDVEAGKHLSAVAVGLALRERNDWL